jgi:hypothetical protein
MQGADDTRLKLAIGAAFAADPDFALATLFGDLLLLRRIYGSYRPISKGRRNLLRQSRGR